MRVFATKESARLARKERIGIDLLCDAVERAAQGLVDADLGGGLIKQRVARPGQGRSRGYRTIVAFRFRDRSIFMYGFAKSGKADLGDDELKVYRRLATAFLGASLDGLAAMAVDGELKEIECDDQASHQVP